MSAYFSLLCIGFRRSRKGNTFSAVQTSDGAESNHFSALHQVDIKPSVSLEINYHHPSRTNLQTAILDQSKIHLSSSLQNSSYQSDQPQTPNMKYLSLAASVIACLITVYKFPPLLGRLHTYFAFSLSDIRRI